MAKVGSILLLLVTLSSYAEENGYLINFDLNLNLPDGSEEYSVQLHGIHLVAGEPFHGKDLGQYEYFLTVSGVERDQGILTIEFYKYETRKKQSDVISEIVSDVEFSLNSPAVFEAMNEAFGVDLAFSIDRR